MMHNRTRQQSDSPLRSHLTRRSFLRATSLAAPVAWLAGQVSPSALRATDATAAKDLTHFLVHTQSPLNAEPQLAELFQSWLTPVRSFYVRNHGPIPAIDPATYRISVEGLVERPLTLSLAELREKFGTSSVTATMACAGNRRAEMARQKPISGVPWQAGAIGNAVWSGVRIADVLKAAGLRGDAGHVWFDGLDQHDVKGHATIFGGSISLDRALSKIPGSDALLATHMNEEPLLPEHGAPLRAVVPGYIGARSVKWLQRIVVSDRPSDNHYVQHAYRLIETDTEAAWSQASILYELPIQSAFCVPADGAQVPTGKLVLRGYAHAAGAAGKTIRAVEISADEGKTWTKAQLGEASQAYCWRLWNANVTITPDTNSLSVRCVDSDGKQQPQRADWNAKGYMQYGWQRIAVKPVTSR